ncbi:MAG: hypothetical protein QNJ36_17600, partial [Calothrix sp. MO_167.B42]|nr:hypothetical protein [Calothrix sp. MO_167.B42]
DDATDTGTGSIVDNDVVLPINVTISDANAVEGKDDYLVFDVTLSTTSSEAITLDLAAVDGSASGGLIENFTTEPIDYANQEFEVSSDGGHTWHLATNGTEVTFAANQTALKVRLAVNDDTADEELTAETMSLGVASVLSGTVDDATDTGTGSISDTAPEIDVWYGSEQTFGHIGQAQTWINILGNVSSPNGVSSLTYSLNGSPEIPLSIGTKFRLLEPGDFNVDIAYTDLDGSPVDDTVVITATDTLGNIATETITIDYESGDVWPDQYSIDWSNVTEINDVAQVVDGLWTLEDNDNDGDYDGVRTAEPGYDRLIAIGDINTWDDYEVTVPVTIHDLNGTLGGVGVIMRWVGHTDDPIAGAQPKAGWVPLGGIGWYTNGQLEINGAVQERELQEGSTYYLTTRVETITSDTALYSIKLWEEGQTEPTAWDLQSLTSHWNVPTGSTGSIALIAHQYDVTFGNVTVTSLPDDKVFTGTDSDDTLIGTDSDDTLIAVDLNNANPGLGEVDNLTGLAGADIFVLGDAAQIYYDDGISNNPGLEDYAVIIDFNIAQQDIIQLHGDVSSYQLMVNGSDTEILVNGQELIGIVKGVNNLDINSNAFSFV